ncbi:MAG TPA: hypothetical protein VL426_07545 [Candidatus Binatia bacterium]|nr:hypothetical protein [Candidatus Binatia bacterium]
MAEGDDYTPAPWAAQHDFKSARASYDRNAGRSYADAQAKNVTASDLVPESIATKSKHPLLIWCDTTGSMGGWPGVMFSKIPYLDHEMRTEYLGEDAEVSFGSITDTGDEYPLQVRPFVQGEGLKTSLEKLVLAGGGSGPGTYCESYAVAALYACRNVKFPKAAGKPTLIIIGDEMPYDLVSRSDAKTFAKVDIEETRLSADAIFKELTEKYSVYLILKPYGGESLTGDELRGVTKDVYERWEKILGARRIAFLPTADRVVDVIFGILAKEADKVAYFREEIEGRQRPDQVETVYKSLLTVHAEDPAPKPKPGASTMHKPAGGKRSKGLLDK